MLVSHKLASCKKEIGRDRTRCDAGEHAAPNDPRVAAGSLASVPYLAFALKFQHNIGRGGGGRQAHESPPCTDRKNNKKCECQPRFPKSPLMRSDQTDPQKSHSRNRKIRENPGFENYTKREIHQARKTKPASKDGRQALRGGLLPPPITVHICITQATRCSPYAPKSANGIQTNRSTLLIAPRPLQNTANSPKFRGEELRRPATGHDRALTRHDRAPSCPVVPRRAPSASP